MEQIMSQISTNNEEELEPSVIEIRDKLGEVLMGKSDYSWSSFVEKFFHFSTKRRVQPGLQSFFNILPISIVLFLVLFGLNIYAFIIAVIVSLALGK